MTRQRSTPSTESPQTEALAVLAGEAWATRCAHDLRAQHRPVSGGWPGTISEATRWVLATLVEHHASSRDLSTERLRALSRTAYGAARNRWRSLAEPDLEP